MRTIKITEAIKCSSPRCCTQYGRRQVINAGQHALLDDKGNMYCGVRCLHNGQRKHRPMGRPFEDDHRDETYQNLTCGSQGFDDPYAALRADHDEVAAVRREETYQANAD